MKILSQLHVFVRESNSANRLPTTEEKLTVAVERLEDTLELQLGGMKRYQLSCSHR